MPQFNFKFLLRSVFLPLLYWSIALIATFVLRNHLERLPAPFFYLAVFASAWSGGISGGLLTSLLSVLALDYLFLQPTFQLLPISIEDSIVLTTFFIISALVSRMIAKIRNSEYRLNQVLEAATDGYWDWDLRTGEVYYSPKWVSFLGFSSDEFPPNVDSWKSLVHPEDLPATVKSLNDYLEKRSSRFEVEYRIKSKSGEWKPVLGRGQVVARDRLGRPLRMVGVNRDMSIFKQAQENQMARKIAEASNAAKDQFISLISHELKNPLATITMATEALADEFKEPKIQLLSRIISRSAKMQMMLINDLLDWSRLKSGKFELHLRPTSVSELIDSAWSTIKTSAEKNKIHFHCSVDPRAEAILGDSNRLTQVMWNLFSNAVKFTPENGSISVHVQAVDHGIRIAVTDTGRGIPAEHLPHVFDRYYQISKVDQSKLGGLGLGLSIVQEIIERHNGRIWADSRGEGKGSTFFIELKDCLIAPKNLVKSLNLAESHP